MMRRFLVGAVSWFLVSVCGGMASAGDVRSIQTVELQQFLKTGGSGVYLLDVRTAGEVAAGRIPGSVHIPMNRVPSQLEAIPKNAKIVVICASGARSGAVAKLLTDRGYPWVANYVDGVMDWTRRGLPLQR